MVEKLKKICITYSDVNLKSLCTIHIGGIGKYVCYPQNIQELKKLIKYLNKKQVSYFVLGNGSNIVFEDGVNEEVIICMKKLTNYTIKNENVIADAGINLFALNFFCKENALEGLEWSYGIPGTLGGAVYMNAGAFGYEIKDFVKCAWVLQNEKTKKIMAGDMGFGYRETSFMKNGAIILKVKLCFKNGVKEEIEQRQKYYITQRKCLQPYGEYSAGSVFKKSNGISAGKIIDKLGLKGVKIGDIEISNKHANFFVNLGNGTSEDLHKLISNVKEEVKNKENINLEEEIVFVGNKKE